MEKEERNGSLIPEKGNPKVGLEVFRIFEEVVRDKDSLGLPSRWKRNAELVRNKFWKSSSSAVPLTSANLLYTHVRRVVNQLTDNNPTFNIIPEGETPEDQKDAFAVLHETTDYWWGETEQQKVFRDSVWNGETTGSAIEKVIFNPALKNGLGDCEVIPVDPFHFGVYPVNCTNIRKADAVLHFRPMTVAEVKRKWPGKADKVVSDDTYIKDLGDDRREIAGGKPDTNKGYYGSISSAVKLMNTPYSLSKDSEDQVLVVEIWVRDRTRLSSERVIESENTGEEIRNKKEIKSKPKYTGEIRKIVACNLGNVVLEDADNPSINPNLPPEVARKTYLYDKFPFWIAQSIENPFSVWGGCDFEQLEPIQTEMNKTLSQITYFKDKSVRSKLVLPKTCGVSPSEMNNAVGIIQPSNAMEAAAIRHLEHPQIPVDLYNHLEVMKGLFFLVSGAFDLDQAQFPGQDVIAYKAIAALLERSSAMQRHKEMAYTALVRERGRMFISNVQNWYTEDRYIAVDRGGRPQPLKINGESLRIPANLTVVSGSTMPVSNVQRREEAIVLYEKGLVDQEEALKRLDWPDYMDVVLRMRQGPLSDLLGKMKQMGVPEPVVNLFQAISQMKPEDFGKAMKAGQIPDFMSVLKVALTGQQQGPTPEQTLEMQKGQSEAAKNAASAKKTDMETRALALKTDAEVQLLAEKILTERLDREIKKAGVDLDYKKLDQEAAKVVSDIETRKVQQEHEAARIVNDIESKQRTDNRADVQTAHDISLKHQAQESEDKFRERETQGPFVDKGTKSDNKEIEA